MSEVRSVGRNLVVTALCLMMCTVPLVYLPGVYKYGQLPKLLALHACAVILFLGWALHTRWGREVQRVSSPLFVPALLFVGAGLLSARGTTHPLDTFVELVNQAVLVSVFFAVANALPPQGLAPVLWASAGTGLVVGAIGILQYHGLAFLSIPSNALPSATLSSRNLAAEYLICVIPLALMLFVTARRTVASLLSGLSATAMVVFLVYTRARGPWVGACAGVLVLSALMIVCTDLRGRVRSAVAPGFWGRKGAIAFGFLILGINMSALPPDRRALVERGLPHLPEPKSDVASTARSILIRDEEAGYDQSREGRLAIWGVTLRMVADHPLLGVGPGNWSRAYPPYDRGATINAINSFQSPHNDFLWIASEYGLPGLAIYLWLVILALRGLVRMTRSPDLRHRVAAPALGLSLLSLMGAAFFGFPKDQPQTAMFPYFIFGVIGAATAVPRRDPSPRASGGLLIGFFLLMALVATDLTTRRIAFDRYYLRAISRTGEARWSDALTEIGRAVEYGVFRAHILIYKGYALEHLNRLPEAEAAYRQALLYKPHAWQAHNGLGSVAIRLGRYQEAQAHCRTALNLFPRYAEAQSNYGVSLASAGDIDGAIGAYRQAITIRPGYAEAYSNLGFALREKGDIDGAIGAYRKAIDIDPRLAEAHSNLGVILIQRGDAEGAIGEWRSALEIDPEYAEGHNNLGIALKNQGDVDGAIRSYHLAIRSRPDYAEAHYNLGNALGSKGELEEAVRELRTCIRLSRAPQLQQKARNRIEQLGGLP